MSATNIILFGDQTVEKLSSIKALVRNSKTSPLASQFLRIATETIQLDLASLSKKDLGWSHDISDILALAEDNAAEKKPNIIVGTVLMCAGRLGELLMHAEEDPSILGSHGNPLEVLGYCSGLLPSAVAVAARDTSELLSLGREIISISFRMSYEISRRMKLIEDFDGSWASTILGVPQERMQKILDDFHKSQNIPQMRRLVIGIVSRDWITIMGAPSSMSRLWEYSPELDRAAKIRTDSPGPLHNPYMPGLDLEKVIGSSTLLNIPLSSKARIISPSSCMTYNHPTLRSLLGEMITDIVNNMQNFHGSAEKVIADIASRGEKASIIVCGPTGQLPMVKHILEENRIQYEIRQLQDNLSNSLTRGGSDLIAVVGMAGKFPGSETVEGFWEDLLIGKDQIKSIPKDRFDLGEFYDASGEKKSSTTAQHGAFLDNPGLFDNRLFNISPREAAQMDPIQRLLLTTTYEALEMAGYSPNATLSTASNRISTFFGQASDDWLQVLNNEGVDIYYIPSVSRAFSSGRVNYHYKFGGASYSLDTACSTSTTAVSLACSSLIARKCDTALAGGGSICVSPNTFSGLTRAGMVSETGGCRTYHDDADGYARGEGVGVVVLKRLEDAISENDNILGVIKAWGRQYTTDSTSITHPSAESQARMYEEVLRQANISPNDISYVEMHGTGTQSGDLEEMNSVISILGGRKRTRDNPLTVGAVKANVGHGEAAAGVTSLIKVLMMMQERKIAPQPGMPFKLNHEFPPLDKLNIRIADRGMVLKPGPGGNGKIKAMVNSFDASGGNTSLVIEEAPDRVLKTENCVPWHVVAISAKTSISLQENRQRMLDFLIRNPDTKICDLAYTTTARRMHEVLRIAYAAESTQDFVRQLRSDIIKGASNVPKSKSAKYTRIFVFTGQGSSYAGMGKELYLHSKEFREIVTMHQDIGKMQGLPNFVTLISDGNLDIATTSTVRVQLAIVSLEIALARMWQIWGVQPDVVLGHSLGEYAALCVSGVLSVSDTLHLVGQRAMLMEKKLTAGAYAMLAVNSGAESLKLAGSLQIACRNTSSMTVVSGTVSDITELQSQLKSQGTRVTLLKVAYGFHSAQIQPILAEFEELARGVIFTAPKIPVASTLLGIIVKAKDDNIFSPSYLARQARETVDFVGALDACKAASYANDRTQWVEIGPEPICLGLIRATLDVPSTQLLPTLKSNENDWKTICSTLAIQYKSGASIDWPEYHKDFKDSLTLLHLPSYAFDAKVYWTSFVNPKPPAGAIDSTSKLTELPHIPGFPTTSLQRVEKEEIEGKIISLIFASNTSELNLHRAIQGHSVHGITITPLTIFCDMALSGARYAYSRLFPEKPLPNMSLTNVEMTHALVVPEKNPDQIIKTAVSYTATCDTLQVSFHSVTSGTTMEHGGCQVVFGESNDWKSKLSQTLFLLKARIQSLKDLATSGKAHRLLKPVVYKLFSNLVIYSKDYQGMEEVWLDSEFHDAVGTIELAALGDAGSFLYNPYWMDTAIHLAGFLLNGSLKYSEDIACLSTGFEKFTFYEELQPGTTYTTYVNMQDTGKNSILSGDAYVFNGDKLVSVTTGIKFQKMKKVVLDSILRSRNASSSYTTKAPSKQSKKITPKPMDIDCIESYPLDLDPKTSDAFDSDSSVVNISSRISRASTPASSVDDDLGSEVIQTMLSAIAAESGYSVEDMENETEFADMGLDSLMAITIIASIHRDIGQELPGSFFLDNPTVGLAKAALAGPHSSIDEPLEAEILSPSPKKPAQSTPPALVTSFSQIQSIMPPTAPVTPTSPPKKSAYISKTILLQGKPSNPGPKLFLFPDGMGSPVNYIQLPALAADLCILGLESPFTKSPLENTCSVEEMADIYIESIRTQQPSGPYLLGGFSFGAIYAYEVARKLLAANELVHGLLLIDMAVPSFPHRMSPDFQPTIEHIEAAGLLPTVGRKTMAQKEHLRSIVSSVLKWRPLPLSSQYQPKKTILIATELGLASSKETSSDLAQWIGGNWNASETKGWGDLLGVVEVDKVDGEHFLLLSNPTVKKLGPLCKDAVAKFRG